MQKNLKTTLRTSIVQACSFICLMLVSFLPKNARAQSLSFELVEVNSFKFGLETDPFESAYFEFKFKLGAVGDDIYIDRRNTYLPPGIDPYPGNGLAWTLTPTTNLNGFGQFISTTRTFETVVPEVEPITPFFEISEGEEKLFIATFFISTDKEIDIGFEIIGLNWTADPLNLAPDLFVEPHVQSANVSLNTSVPEPGSMALLIMGIAGSLCTRRRTD